LVWDAPTRLFHWGIVLLLAGSWITQYEGWMTQHVLCGYAMTAALLFRLIWGVIGSDTARFGRFLRSPLAALRHLAHLHRRTPDIEIGHNAAGGWMVLLMLLLIGVQAGTGLCANDEVSVQGPLAETVGPTWSDRLSHIHALNFQILEAAIVLHLLAILAYRVLRGHRLVWPMVTGRKALPAALPAPRIASPRAALVALGAAVGLVGFAVLWFGG
jgi:cytochrome b